MLAVEIGTRLSTTRCEAGKRNSMAGHLRVMVLDTSLTSRKILEVVLHREGHQVVCFDDPLEALRFLCRHGPADLLFLSLDLPKKDGYDVLMYLKGTPRFHSMASVALLNERDGVLVRLKARLAGAQQVVTKPLVRQQIVALVSECPCRRATPPEADQGAGSPALEDGEAAFSTGRNEPGGTASTRTV